MTPAERALLHNLYMARYTECEAFIEHARKRGRTNQPRYYAALSDRAVWWFKVRCLEVRR